MFFLYELGANSPQYEAFVKMAIAVNLNAESNAVLNIKNK